MDPRNSRTGNPIRDNDRGRKDRGAVLMEFVFSFILFLLVTLVGVMDLGRAIWVHNVLAHASHEAARYTIVRGGDSLSPATESSIRDYLRSRATFLPFASVTVGVQWQPDNSPGNTVQIQASHNFQPLLVPFLPAIVLSSTSRMVITN